MNEIVTKQSVKKVLKLAHKSEVMTISLVSKLNLMVLYRPNSSI